MTATMTYEPKVGMKGTTSGFKATIREVCEWSRSERGVIIVVAVPGGQACIPARDFIPEL